MQKEFKNREEYNIHIRDDETCSIYHNLDALMPKFRTDENCNISCKSYKDLHRQMKYRCHLSDSEKQYFMNKEYANITIDRRVFEQRGLPREDTYMLNGNIKYQICDKTWNCVICEKSRKIQLRANYKSCKL